MPFKSANLKLIYEELRAAGLPISASEAGRLFRTGDLERLLDTVRARQTEINTLIARIESLRARVALLTEADPFYLIYLGMIDDDENRLHELIEHQDPRERWL